MKKDKRMFGLVAVLAVVAILGVVFGGTMFAVPTTTEFEPVYPVPITSKLYAPVYGTIDCYNTGDKLSVSTPHLIVDGLYGKIWYTCNNIFGCEVSTFNIECISTTYGCPGAEYSKDIRVGSYSGTILPYPYKINKGQSYYFTGQCWFPTCDVYGKWAPSGSTIEITGDKAKLRIDSYGYTKAGWLDGSAGCKLVSVDAVSLKDMQIITDNPLSGVSTILPGQTKNVIVGWREDPVVGTIKTYIDGSNVECRNYDGIYKINTLDTIGGNDYYIRGEQIVTYAGTNSMCCDNTGCSGGYTCEDFKCVAEPVICEYGSGNCEWGSPAGCESGTGECEELAGDKYRIRTWGCDSDGCCQPIDNYQKCCPATCARMSTLDKDYYCNPGIGCVEIITPTECGTGFCCNVAGEGDYYWLDQGLNVDNSQYTTQSCGLATVCCYENAADPFRGTCKEECGFIPSTDCQKLNEQCGSGFDPCCTDLICKGGIMGVGGTCQVEVAECQKLNEGCGIGFNACCESLQCEGLTLGFGGTCRTAPEQPEIDWSLLMILIAIIAVAIIIAIVIIKKK